MIRAAIFDLDGTLVKTEWLKMLLEIYEPGRWGPALADEFLARDARQWVRGCSGHSAMSR
ncbi:MAG: hypothetical protein HY782_09705 [Chloroflexi bacterium]|nr:hypothetical protein [Chloroflexota bacterium]